MTVSNPFSPCSFQFLPVLIIKQDVRRKAPLSRPFTNTSKHETFARYLSYVIIINFYFQDEESAKAFYQKFKDVTSNPELNVLNNPNINNKKKKDKRQSIKKKPAKLPKKIDISLPCQFSHVTQLKQSEDGILALTMVDDETASSEDGTIDSK